MEKIKINPVGLFSKPLNSKKAETPTSQTNPFGVSFKGIVQADTFEKHSVPAFKGGEKTKMLNSALVSAFGSMSERFKTEFRTVIEFANKVKQGLAEAKSRVVDFYKSADEIKITGESFAAMGKRVASYFKELVPQKRGQRPIETVEAELDELIKSLA